MNKFSLALLGLITSYSPLIAVEPTELREWKSVNGKTVTAKATAFDGETVSMETANGKSYQVPLTKLAKSEHDFLTAHFETKDEEEPSTPDAPKPPSKKGKKGTIQGIEKQTSEVDSFYYHYVPTSALKDRKMPAMFWTSGGKKGDQKSVSTFTKGAELTGMTIITCGTRNRSHLFRRHIRRCSTFIRKCF